MGFIKFFFGKRRRRFLEDPDFGRIEEEKSGSWTGHDFGLWGYSSVQIMLNAGPEGPTHYQRSFVRALRSDYDGIRKRVEAEVEKEARTQKEKTGRLNLTSIFLPGKPPEETWRVWYDEEGEEQYWYGAEITGWQKIVPFTED